MIEEVFNLFDTDGQQQLDEEELASAIFALGLSQNGHLEVVENVFVLAYHIGSQLIHDHSFPCLTQLAKTMMDQVDEDGSRTVRFAMCVAL
jgi:hypothetical protein